MGVADDRLPDEDRDAALPVVVMDIEVLGLLPVVLLQLLRNSMYLL